MLGERLTKLRQEKHLSQRELGEIILVSGYTISAYELGRSEIGRAMTLSGGWRSSSMYRWITSSALLTSPFPTAGTPTW